MIQQDVTIMAALPQVFAVFLSGDDFAAMTGSPAEIGESQGDSATMFGGMITARHLEIVPGQRLVQAWRAGNWAEGDYSIVRFDFAAEDGRTRIRMSHRGFPEGSDDHLREGWPKRYWEPLAAYFAA